MNKEKAVVPEQKWWRSSHEIMANYSHLFPIVEPTFFRPARFTEGDFSFVFYPTSFHQPESIRRKRFYQGINQEWADKAQLVLIRDTSSNIFQTALCYGGKKHGYVHSALALKMKDSGYRPEVALQADLVVASDRSQSVTFTRANSLDECIIAGCHVLATLPASERGSSFKLSVGGVIIDLIAGSVMVKQSMHQDASKLKEMVEQKLNVTLPPLQQNEFVVSWGGKETKYTEWQTAAALVPDLLDHVRFNFL